MILHLNVNNIKTPFPDGQIGRTECTIQINFGENLLNLLSKSCRL